MSSIREYIGQELFIVDKNIKRQIVEDFISEEDFFNFYDIEDETEYLKNNRGN